MKVYVNCNDKRWKKYKIDFEKIANAAVLPAYKDSEVSITLVDDDEIHALNCQYRNIDKPTNVLSFELGDDILLGDIYISIDTVMREAKTAKISIEEHVAHLVVHGVLHVQGYDHITDAQARVMENKEVKILKRLGIKNPYCDEIRIPWWKYGLCALFGCVASFGFAPFYMFFLSMIGFGGLYWILLDNRNVVFWKSLSLTAVFGAMYSISMFWWSLHSIYVVPELATQFAIWTIPAIIGLGIFGVIVFGLPLVVFCSVRIKSGALPFLFAFVWCLSLWCREWLFTGFPWNPIANILLPFPIIANSMSFWGALGTGFVVIGCIASVINIIKNKKNFVNWLNVIIFFCLLLLGCVFGYLNIQLSQKQNDSPVVRIVQPALSQSEKMIKTRAEAIGVANEKIEKLNEMVGDVSNIDFIVFPETSYPFILQKDIVIPNVFAKPIVFGANTFDDGKMFNSMLVVDKNGNIESIYNKSHLVPFGEYSPFGFMPAPINLSVGHNEKNIFVNYTDNKKFMFAPAICYEIIFSGAVTDNGKYDAIINITNDTWFGKTPGTYQHLDMVRRYAIESGLPIIRANYSGISAFVAPDGNIDKKIDVGVSGVVDGTVYGGHITAYRVLGRDVWFVIILLFSLVGIFVMNKLSQDD